MWVTRRVKRVCSPSVTSSHLNLNKCSPLRLQCCRWGCQADRANRSIFYYSPSSDLELSKCLTVIATLIPQPSCQAVDVRPLPENGKKVLNIKSSALQAGRLVCWRLTFEGNFPFNEIENRTAERQFFNFDICPSNPTLPFISRQETTLVPSRKFLQNNLKITSSDTSRSLPDTFISMFDCRGWKIKFDEL